MYERGREHWRDYRSGHEDSHILKHHLLHHGGEGVPEFHFRPIMFVKTALTRQIAEAVWIQRWGEDIVLNSKAEFNRCTISRLTIGEEDRPSKTNKDPQGPGEEVGEEVEGEQEIQEWVVERTTMRRAQEIMETDSLRRGVIRSPANKRLGGMITEESSPAKKSKRKYPLLAANWGVEECEAQQPPLVETRPIPVRSCEARVRDCRIGPLIIISFYFISFHFWPLFYWTPCIYSKVG